MWTRRSASPTSSIRPRTRRPGKPSKRSASLLHDSRLQLHFHAPVGAGVGRLRDDERLPVLQDGAETLVDMERLVLLRLRQGLRPELEAQADPHAAVAQDLG